MNFVTPNSWGTDLREENKCHLPSGAPESKGGEFAHKGEGICDPPGAGGREPSSRAATHEGTCQLCGHQQALPRGFLAKHGYNVKWGFFSGTCTGSECKPFEQSIDKIEDSIQRVSKSMEELRAEAIKTRNEDGPDDKVWLHVYVYEPREGKGHHEWQHVPLIVQEHTTDESYAKFSGKPAFTYYTYEAKVQVKNRKTGEREEQVKKVENIPHDQQTRTEAGVRRFLNNERAKWLEGQATQMQGYIDWQKSRIANWAPKPLIPRATPASRREAPITRVRKDQWVILPDGKGARVAAYSKGIAFFRNPADPNGKYLRIPVGELRRG